LLVDGRRPRSEDDLVLQLDGHLPLELGELDLPALDLVVQRAGQLLVLLALGLQLPLLLGELGGGLGQLGVLPLEVGDLLLQRSLLRLLVLDLLLVVGRVLLGGGELVLRDATCTEQKREPDCTDETVRHASSLGDASRCTPKGIRAMRPRSQEPASHLSLSISQLWAMVGRGVAFGPAT